MDSISNKLLCACFVASAEVGTLNWIQSHSPLDPWTIIPRCTTYYFITRICYESPTKEFKHVLISKSSLDLTLMKRHPLRLLHCLPSEEVGKMVDYGLVLVSSTILRGD